MSEKWVSWRRALRRRRPGSGLTSTPGGLGPLPLDEELTYLSLVVGVVRHLPKRGGDSACIGWDREYEVAGEELIGGPEFRQAAANIPASWEFCNRARGAYYANDVVRLEFYDAVSRLRTPAVLLADLAVVVSALGPWRAIP